MPGAVPSSRCCNLSHNQSRCGVEKTMDIILAFIRLSSRTRLLLQTFLLFLVLMSSSSSSPVAPSFHVGNAACVVVLSRSEKIPTDCSVIACEADPHLCFIGTVDVLSNTAPLSAADAKTRSTASWRHLHLPQFRS